MDGPSNAPSRRRVLRWSAPALATSMAGCSGLLGDWSPLSSPPSKRWTVETGVTGGWVGRFKTDLAGDHAYFVDPPTFETVSLKDGNSVASVDVGDPANFTVQAGRSTVLVTSDDQLAAYGEVPASDPRWTMDDRRSATIVPGTGVVVNESDGFVAMAPADGSVNWQTENGLPDDELRVWTDDTLVCGRRRGDDAAVFTLDAATGSRRWVREPLKAESEVGDLMVDEGAAYLSSRGIGDGWVISYDLQDGTRRWKTNIGKGDTFLQAIAGGTVFASEDDGGDELVGLDGATGEKRWSKSLGSTLDTADGTLLALGTDRSLFAMGPGGSTQWTAEIPDAESLFKKDGTTALTELIDGTLVVEFGDQLWGFDWGDGSKQWQYDHGEIISELWSYDGDVVIRTDGELCRVELP